MDIQYLPNDIIDLISLKLHNLNMKSILEEIVSPLKLIHFDGIDYINNCNIKTYIDNYCYYYTLVFIFNNETIVVYHQYNDDVLHPERCIFEGYLTKEGIFKIKNFSSNCTNLDWKSIDTKPLFGNIKFEPCFCNKFKIKRDDWNKIDDIMNSFIN